MGAAQGAVAPRATDLPPLFVNYHITHCAGTTVEALAKRSGLVPAGGDGRNAIYLAGTVKMMSTCQSRPEHVQCLHPPDASADVPPDAFAAALNLTRASQLARWRSHTCGGADVTKSWWHEAPDGTGSVIDGDSPLCPAGRRGPARSFLNVEQAMYPYAWSVFPWAAQRQGVATMTVLRHPLTQLHSLWAHIGMPGTKKAFHNKANRTDAERLLGSKPGPAAMDRTGDNYMVRWLAGNTVKTAPIGEADVRRAIDRLGRFDNVAIVEALEDTLSFLCDDWGWTVCDPSIHGRPLLPNKATAEPIALRSLRAFMAETTDDTVNTTLLAAVIEQYAPSFALYDAGVELARARLRATGAVSQALERLPRDSLAEARDLVAQL